GTRGVGFELALAFARRGARVWVVARDGQRAKAAELEIRRLASSATVYALRADLSLLSDVKRVVAQVSARESKLDCLVCNAGVVSRGESERRVTAERVEYVFALHLLCGRLALSLLFLPLLRQSDDPRVIFVSSPEAYLFKYPGTGVAASEEGSYNPSKVFRYVQRGQLLLAKRLASAHADVLFASAHPGWVDTEGLRATHTPQERAKLSPLRMPWQGAHGIGWLAAAPSSKVERGGFYLDGKLQPQHMSGAFFTGGNATTNSDGEEEAMLASLQERLNSLSQPKTCMDPRYIFASCRPPLVNYTNLNQVVHPNGQVVIHPAGSDSLEPKSDADGVRYEFVKAESAASHPLVVITYPAKCNGPAYSLSYRTACEKLRRMEPGYALLHDFRATNPKEFDARVLLADAVEIAREGRLVKVGFVLVASGFIASTLCRLCPVQPARSFEDFQEARVHSSSGLTLCACSSDVVPSPIPIEAALSLLKRGDVE
ncbi:MAG: hypothetical protein SGPRY_011617, partial [Prymnesium sp.]